MSLKMETLIVVLIEIQILYIWIEFSGQMRRVREMIDLARKSMEAVEEMRKRAEDCMDAIENEEEAIHEVIKAADEVIGYYSTKEKIEEAIREGILVDDSGSDRETEEID